MKLNRNQKLELVQTMRRLRRRFDHGEMSKYVYAGVVEELAEGLGRLSGSFDPEKFKSACGVFRLVGDVEKTEAPVIEPSHSDIEENMLKHKQHLKEPYLEVKTVVEIPYEDVPLAPGVPDLLEDMDELDRYRDARAHRQQAAPAGLMRVDEWKQQQREEAEQGMTLTPGYPDHEQLHREFQQQYYYDEEVSTPTPDQPSPDQPAPSPPRSPYNPQ